MDDEIKKVVKAVPIKGKQPPDRSFKAPATGVLKKLGEKVADESGGTLAKGAVDKVGSFIGGLLNGDVKGATESVGAGDFVDV